MKKPSHIPLSIWAIGMATFLTNLSTVIIFGYSAVYLNAILGVTSGLIGFLEGVVEATAYLTKLLSGMLSDYFKKRKPWVVAGFGLSATSRPLLALSTTLSISVAFWGVFIARMLDRLGNGLQATPRDALVGDLAPDDIKGTCFGLRQSLATAGSFTGSVVGIILMRLTGNDYQIVFAIAAIPTIMAVIVLIAFVKEKNTTQESPSHKKIRQPIRLADVSRLGSVFWGLMVIIGIFMVARVGEAFLVLHARNNFGLDDSYAQIILMLYNGANCLISYPVGRFSDRIDRKYLLAFGFVALVISDMLLAFAGNLFTMMAGVIFWGVQIGVTQSMSLALISDIVPSNLRGTAIGFYYLISAFSLFIAGSIGLKIANTFGESVLYLVSGGIGFCALICLIVFTQMIKRTKLTSSSVTKKNN